MSIDSLLLTCFFCCWFSLFSWKAYATLFTAISCSLNNKTVQHCTMPTLSSSDFPFDVSLNWVLDQPTSYWENVFLCWFLKGFSLCFTIVSSPLQSQKTIRTLGNNRREPGSRSYRNKWFKWHAIQMVGLSWLEPQFICKNHSNSLFYFKCAVCWR